MQKIILKKIFFKLMKKMREYIGILIFVTTEERRNHLASEPDYKTTKLISENLLAIEMKKT